MRFKPYATVNVCYKCKCPVPRIGVSVKTGVGNINLSTPFICPNCKRKRGKK